MFGYYIIIFFSINACTYNVYSIDLFLFNFEIHLYISESLP